MPTSRYILKDTRFLFSYSLKNFLHKQLEGQCVNTSHIHKLFNCCGYNCLFCVCLLLAIDHTTNTDMNNREHIYTYKEKVTIQKRHKLHTRMSVVIKTFFCVLLLHIFQGNVYFYCILTLWYNGKHPRLEMLNLLFFNIL